ncbi:hypothetical protein [Erythrobacter sp. YT30]|uniref:hypothetical protein n=1 Tax=Erythrobacter sp. YT30 TaxID=1735012 RepID=UPI0012E36818|nr:hypothetical protein [Erythrobacter sp. YT30]
MLQRAMHISTSTKAVVLALVASSIGLASPAASQDVDGDDVKDVAETPLEDIGLSSDEIPEALVEAAKDPYASEGFATCNSIVAEVAKLDTVLGEDYDIAGAADTGLDMKGAAKSVVGSIIPFRGVVREISGAAGDERKMRAAVIAGMVRRGYLKGLGQSRGCDYPARPKIQEAETEE